MKKKMANRSEQTMSTRMTMLNEVQEDGDEPSLTSVDYAVEDSSSNGETSIARRENCLVGYSKIAVLLVIVSVAAGMGCITYAFVKEKEKSEYVNHVSSLHSSRQRQSQMTVSSFTHIRCSSPKSSSPALYSSSMKQVHRWWMFLKGGSERSTRILKVRFLWFPFEKQSPAISNSNKPFKRISCSLQCDADNLRHQHRR